jgi:hypothetical protein
MRGIRVGYLTCRPKPNRLSLLSYSECCQIDQDQAVLSPRQSKAGMAGDLQYKVSVPPLIK